LRRWMLLIYMIPNHPTSARVFVWRKLKRLGAVLLHDSVWVLPATAHTREQFRWLATEIAEMKGAAHIWEAELTLTADEDKLVAQINRAVDTTYREILAALGRRNADVSELSKRFQQVQLRDYFQTDIGKRARAAFIAARGGPKR